MPDFRCRSLTESEWREKWRDDVMRVEMELDLHDPRYQGWIYGGAFRCRVFVAEFPQRKVVWGGEAECQHHWGEVKGGLMAAIAALCNQWKADRNQLPRPKLYLPGS